MSLFQQAVQRVVSWWKLPTQWRFPDGSVDVTIIRSLLPTLNGFARVTPSCRYTTCEALVDAILSVRHQQYCLWLVHGWRMSTSLPVSLSLQLHTASEDTPTFFTVQLVLDVLQLSLSNYRLCVLLHEWSSRWRLAKVSQAFTVLRPFLPRCEPMGYDMALAHTSYQIEQVTVAWAAMRHRYLSSLILQPSPDFALIEALCEYSQCAFVTSSRMVPIYAILVKHRLRMYMTTWLSAISERVDRFTCSSVRDAIHAIPSLPPLHTAGRDIPMFLSAQLLSDTVRSALDSIVLSQSLLSWQMHCYEASLSCSSPWDVYLLYQMTHCVMVMQYTRALQSWLLNIHYSTEHELTQDHDSIQLLQDSPDELPQPSMSLSLQFLPGGDYALPSSAGPVFVNSTAITLFPEQCHAHRRIRRKQQAVKGPAHSSTYVIKQRILLRQDTFIKVRVQAGRLKLRPPT